jgi:transcriptional regulator
VYIPTANRIEDPARIRAFMSEHGFAAVVSQDQGSPWASHLPLLLDESPNGDRLLGHMALANEQWRHFASGSEVLCIFLGPHSYISPSWYRAKIAVPTWNYAAVHAYGIPSVETDPAFVKRVLDETVAKYESVRDAPWKMDFPEETVSAYLKAIVAFSVRVTRIEAKFKLGQNRSEEDRSSMLSALETSSEPESVALARFTRLQG